MAGLWLVVFLYGFSAACLLNFCLMRTKLNASEFYRKLFKERNERTEALLAANPGKTAEGFSAEDYIPRGRPLKVVFLHPDLGIGGAERLIVDAAVGLQSHQSVMPKVDVTIVTNRHDRTRAFEETTNGTIKVRVAGNIFPASIFGRCKVLCATVRMILAAVSTCWRDSDTDIFIVDQVAAVMPVLRHLAPLTPVLFYCHFPDKQCDPNRDENGDFIQGQAVIGLHGAYREFFDTFEAFSMGFATNIVCNSQFSLHVTVSAFPRLADKINPDQDVLYPPVATAPPAAAEASAEKDQDSIKELVELLDTHTTFVSLNRYERKKHVELAVEAFLKLTAAQKAGTAPQSTKPLLLIVAGGYDPSLNENVAYADELSSLVKEQAAGADGCCDVRFLKNINTAQKELLLSKMSAMVYTPPREHFGIVPVESMQHKKPVIAVNFGGPKESIGAPADSVHVDDAVEATVADVVEAQGGLLCAPTVEAFASAMERLVADEMLAERLGEQGYRRVQQLFTHDTFSEKLAQRIWKLCNSAQLSICEELKDTASLAPPSKTDTSEKKTN